MTLRNPQKYYFAYAPAAGEEGLRRPPLHASFPGQSLAFGVPEGEQTEVSVARQDDPVSVRVLGERDARNCCRRRRCCGRPMMPLTSCSATRKPPEYQEKYRKRKPSLDILVAIHSSWPRAVRRPATRVLERGRGPAALSADLPRWLSQRGRHAEHGLPMMTVQVTIQDIGGRKTRMSIESVFPTSMAWSSTLRWTGRA